MALSSEQKVGLFFLAALIVLGLMIEFVEDWRPFEEEYAYHAYFESTVGLKASDPVRVAGVEMGKVSDIRIEDNRVRVDFYVTRADSVHQDSVARIRQANLLGGVFLGIELGSPGSSPLPAGSEVTSRESANIDQLITNLDRNQERVLVPLGEMVDATREPLVEAINRLERMLAKIDEGKGTFGQLVNNPALYQEMATASSRLNSLLQQLQEGEGSLPRLLRDPDLYDNLNRSMENLATLTTRIRAGEGTIGRLINDEKLYDESLRTLVSLRMIAEQVTSGEGTLGKLYHDETLYDNLAALIKRVNNIAAKVDEGQGTLGRLVNEDDLYRDAKTTLHKVEKSVDGLQDTGPLSALGIVVGTLF